MAKKMGNLFFVFFGSWFWDILVSIYTLEDLKWDKMMFFKVYPFQENVNFEYVVSSNTTDEF